MKGVAREFRDLIVRTDVVADYVHRQTTSGSTDSDNTVVLENKSSVSGYQNYLRTTVTEKHVHDTVFSRDRNWNWKSTNVGTYNTDNDSALNNVSELLPETKKPAMTLSNELADSSDNRRMYDDPTTYNYIENKLLCQIPVSGKTTSAGNRVRPRRTVTTTRQTTTTTKQSVSQHITVHEVPSCVRRRTEVSCTVATPREEVTATGSDQSNYSGVYERDLEEILESASAVNCHIRRRRRNTAAALRSSRQRADKFYFRLPRTPDIKSYRSSSDSCYGRSDSESEPERKLPSEDELNLDDETTAVFHSGSFFRRLNRFLLSGNQGPEMAVIEP